MFYIFLVIVFGVFLLSNGFEKEPKKAMIRVRKVRDFREDYDEIERKAC